MDATVAFILKLNQLILKWQIKMIKIQNELMQPQNTSEKGRAIKQYLTISEFYVYNFKNAILRHFIPFYAIFSFFH